jgi:hypothetical protein
MKNKERNRIAAMKLASAAGAAMRGTIRFQEAE